MTSEIEKKVQESQEIMREIGIPIDDMTKKRRERAALALLAVAKIKPDMPFSSTEVASDPGNSPITTRGIIAFLNEYYGQDISMGSYDDIRRLDLVHLVEAGIVLKSEKSVINDPTRGYTINPEASRVLREYGQPSWNDAVSEYTEKYGKLKDRLERPRYFNKISAKVNDGTEILLDESPHNQIQKAIVEEFLPRFVPGAEILYIGDASNKSLYINEEKLCELKLTQLAHGTLPDVIAYESTKNWLILIEAVHSANPISQLRHLQLERLTKDCPVPIVYVTAFMDKTKLRDWLTQISWETEVWLVDSPDHLIHFNGDKFFGPHKS